MVAQMVMPVFVRPLTTVITCTHHSTHMYHYQPRLHPRIFKIVLDTT